MRSADRASAVRPDLPSIAAVSRRDFLKGLGTAAVGATVAGGCRRTAPDGRAVPSPTPTETAIRDLWAGLTDAQKKEVCLDWDYQDKKRGLVRTFVANHWQVTRPCIRGDFFTKQQQLLIHDIFKSMLNPDWYPRFLKQLKDDTFGHEWGTDQSIALFGRPDGDRFQFAITGRHLTLRAEGRNEGRVAFGGPIFYGHAASGYTESVHHPGNVFWPQALEANKVYQILDGRQRQQALVARRPAEEAVHFRTGSGYPGLPVAEMSADQKEEVQKVLRSLVEPFRVEEQDSVRACLEKQGGLERCSLGFYRDGDLGDDGEWDNWRLEGPAFVWYFRGTPHVHVWVNVADDPSVAITARNGVFLHPEHDPLGAYPKDHPPKEE